MTKKIADNGSALPAEASDSPIWKHLHKRGKVDINDSYSTSLPPVHIYYEVYGSGTERVVFINGMCSNRSMWEANIEQLLSLGTNYQCLVYDHRGTGHSDGGIRITATSVSTLASDLKKLMGIVGWRDGKTNIVGVSMGGNVALNFACRNPDAVKTLTLGASFAKMTFPPLTQVADTARVICSWNPTTKFRNACLAQYPRNHLLSPAPTDSGCNNMLDYYAVVSSRKSKYKGRMSKLAMLGQLLCVFRHKTTAAQLAELGRLLPNKQILVLAGARDRVVNPRKSEYIANCVGRDTVIYEVFDQTAHALHSQEYVRFACSVHSMISNFNKQQNT
ncbi:hypothetical protein H4217_003847 [Coemansia sp. RSA 1939]|nr:hypothetical protein H4217_003847 [Coemansia sp. RSA 1939]KAJ2608158.1 hypothetical protein EV177_005130 [Coemansia sp. RSA 1804]KAJ2692996.1 hypothetical protein GGH99_001388 [Coemansia sp. RSA 1285]